VACWSAKAAISLKRVKIQEKLLWRAYRQSQTFFRTVPSPTAYGLPFPKIGGSQPHPKNAIGAAGTAKATDYKFGRYIHRVHPNKRPLKIGEKRDRGSIQGLPNFLSTPIISGTGKAANFKFGRCIHSVHATGFKGSPQFLPPGYNMSDMRIGVTSGSIATYGVSAHAQRRH